MAVERVKGSVIRVSGESYGEDALVLQKRAQHKKH